MRAQGRKALLFLLFCAVGLAAPKKKVLEPAEPLDADVAERLVAKDYIQFTDLDSSADDFVQWDKDYRQWLYVGKDETFFVILAGTVKPGNQLFLNDRPLDIQGGKLKQRIGVLPEPSQVTLKVIDEKNELHVFRSVYSWLRIPPSIRLKFREEGTSQVVEKKSGYSGELKKAAFTQLTSNGHPLVALDLDSQRRSGLLFQIVFPREAEENYDGWRLVVLDKNKKLVAEIKKQGAPPLFVEWNEVQGKVVLPGAYTYRTDLYKGNKFFEGIQGQFDAVEGRSLASYSDGPSLSFEPKEELGYFTYKNNDSIGRSNLYFGIDLPVAFKDKYLLRAGGLFSSISPDPQNSLTSARAGVGLRFAPEKIDPSVAVAGRVDTLLSFWTFGLYPNAPVERVSHLSLLVEPNLILWGVHYVVPTLEFSTWPGFNSMRASLGVAYQFFIRPWNVKLGFGMNFESLFKHDIAPQTRHTLFRMMGSVAFLI